MSGTTAIDTLREALTGWDDPTGEEERLAALADVEALLQAAGAMTHRHLQHCLMFTTTPAASCNCGADALAAAVRKVKRET